MLVLQLLFSLPKILFYNFRFLPFRTALKLPLLVHHSVKISLETGAKIHIKNPEFGTIKIGFYEGSLRAGKGRLVNIQLERNAVWIMTGKVTIAKNSYIQIYQNGVLECGEEFRANYGLLIKCHADIKFGNDTLLGWKCTFMDSDGHFIVNSLGEIVNGDEKIQIGNHNWICSNVTIFKGSSTTNNCVIAYGATIAEKFYEEGIILGGNYPGKVLRTNISWK